MCIFNAHLQQQIVLESSIDATPLKMSLSLIIIIIIIIIIITIIIAFLKHQCI